MGNSMTGLKSCPACGINNRESGKLVCNSCVGKNDCKACGAPPALEGEMFCLKHNYMFQKSSNRKAQFILYIAFKNKVRLSGCNECGELSKTICPGCGNKIDLELVYQGYKFCKSCYESNKCQICKKDLDDKKSLACKDCHLDFDEHHTYKDLLIRVMRGNFSNQNDYYVKESKEFSEENQEVEKIAFQMKNSNLN